MRDLLLITLCLSPAAAALSPPAAAPADQMSLPDGKHLTGTLELDGKGRLRFAARGQPAPLAVSDQTLVRFPPVPVAAWRAATVHRVTLPNGQHVTGELLELNDQSLKLRTAWAGQLTIPRQAVVAVTHPPGHVTILHDEFENGLKPWQLAGAPSLSDRQRLSGRQSLLLDRPGQSAELALAEPLEAGRAIISFHDPGQASGARWLVEAEFAGAAGPWTARIVVADQEMYEVEAPGPTGKVGRIRRSKGWHRVSLRFDRAYLLVGVDDQLLWASGKEGPGGPLRKLRLVCAAQPGGGAVQGEVFFDDLSLVRAVDELPHRREDAGQDEAWLLSGDQLAGRVLRTDRGAIQLQMESGEQTLDWGRVRGLFFRRPTLPLRTTNGEHVRLWFHSGTGDEPDELEGILHALDARRLALRHPVLGELEIDRGRLQRLRRLFHGRRIELDNGFHHLGDPKRIVPELQPARAEGMSRRWPFRLDIVPAEARLVVHAAYLKGPGDGIGNALERGDLRTDVIVNGQRVDYLNRHVERSPREPVRITMVLPRRCLQAGVNVLELKQLPDRATERYESCGIDGIALEVPR